MPLACTDIGDPEINCVDSRFDSNTDQLLLEFNRNGSMKGDYKNALRMASWRIHADEEYGHEDRLGCIVKEVKLRIEITKKEIYNIGELLVEAKKIVVHGHFKNWIAETFDFSYDTANNFMNVFKACLGNPEIVTTMKASVLYKIAAPGFPEDLREYIFEQGDITLDCIKSQDIKELLRRYKAGELDLEAAEIKKFFRRNQRWVQLAEVYDRLTLSTRELLKQKKGIANMGAMYDMGYDQHDGVGQDRIAGEMIHAVIDAMNGAIGHLLNLRNGIMEYVDERKMGNVP